jgi:GNAT superfamily N-acetyltransferase
MLARPSERPDPAGIKGFSLDAIGRSDVERYLAVYRLLGERWMWFSRLTKPRAEIEAILADPAVEFYAVRFEGGDVGLLELDFRVAGACEIAFFGLVPELAGKGHGAWLMAQALASGWRKEVTRMWVHTCTLDHPGALGFYRRHGFVPFARAVETFADPRLLGILPRDAAPQVPLIDPPS